MIDQLTIFYLSGLLPGPGRLLGSGSYEHPPNPTACEGNIKVWSLEVSSSSSRKKCSLEVELAYSGPKEGIQAMLFSPDERYLITLGASSGVINGQRSALHVVDISDLEAPVQVASLETPGPTSCLAILLPPKPQTPGSGFGTGGPLRFVTGGRDGLLVWRLGEKEKPTSYDSLAVTNNAGSELLNVTALAALEAQATITCGGDLLVGTKDGGLWLVHTAATAPPTTTDASTNPLAFYWALGGPNEEVVNLAVKDNVAVVASTYPSLRISLWDLTTIQAGGPELPRLVAQIIGMDHEPPSSAPAVVTSMCWDDHVQDGIIGTTSAIWYLSRNGTTSSLDKLCLVRI